MSDTKQLVGTFTNAKIVGFSKDPWGNLVVEIRGNNGKIYKLDRRCVNIRNPIVGQRGYLDYREYEFGSRWFFDAV